MRPANVIDISGLKMADLRNVIEICAKLLINGGVLSFPSDTVYGLSCLAQNNKAIKKLYQIKNRNFSKPIAICVESLEQAYIYADIALDKKFISELLPGPYTLIFQRSSKLNAHLNPEHSTVGIRIPKYYFINELSKYLKDYGPLALTSANLSGQTNAVKIEDFSNIWSKLDLVINGGELDISALGSTIIDFSTEIPKINRKGSGLIQCYEIFKEYGFSLQ